jgi:hypothetical protein
MVRSVKVTSLVQHCNDGYTGRQTDKGAGVLQSFNILEVSAEANQRRPHSNTFVWLQESISKATSGIQ